jgi:predicted ferric reductase
LWFAVIISAVVNMIIGAVWYSVITNPWLEGIGKTREWANENQRPADYIIAFVNSLLMAFFLANVMSWVEVSGLGAGIVMGFFVWLGFNGLSFAAYHPSKVVY